ALRDYERRNLAPQHMSLSFAGDVAVSQALISAIVQNQVGSLAGSLIGVLAVTVFVGRSLRWGLICVIPCALAIPLNFAMMGWLAIPLGVATSMFSAMTLGIGDDYAIHLVERVRLALHTPTTTADHGSRPVINSALSEALPAAGRAIVVDALSVALGFGI